MRKVPPNGFVLLSGTCDKRTVYELIAPPLPITRKLYRCDKVFHLNNLLELYQDHSKNGLVLIRGELVEMYLFQGTKRELVDKITICRQKAQKKGGSSANRFLHTQQNQVESYIASVADRVGKVYFDSSVGKPRVKILLVGGTGDLHKRMVAHKDFEHRLDGFVRLVNISDSDCVESLMPEISNLANESEIKEDISQMMALQEMIARNPGQIVYGTDELRRCISSKMIKKLYIHAEAVDAFGDSSIRGVLDGGAEVVYIKAYTAQTKFILDYGGAIATTWYNVDE